jgi:hypothetical protein
MSFVRISVILAAASLATACATTQEQALAPAAASATVASSSDGRDAAPTKPVLVIDVNESVQARPEVICKDILKPGSNVIVSQCMTAANWKLYQRRVEREAQAIVRMLQGSWSR